MSRKHRFAARRRSAAALLAVGASLALAGTAAAAPAPTTLTVHSGSGAAGTTDPGILVSPPGSTTYSQAVNINPNPAYSTIPGTGWVSVNTSTNNPTGNYVYKTTLSVPSNAVNPRLTGAFYSDNQGTAYVNGAQVAQNSPCGGTGEGADYGRSGEPPTAFSSTLAAGADTLSFTVNNCGLVPNPTGLDFTVTATFTLSPIDKGDCKKGGWRDLTDDTGASFKNQGDCVSFVATDGRNLAG